MEVEPFNIRVRVIEPGWFKTNIVANGKIDLDPSSPYAALEAAEYASEQAAVATAADPAVVAAAIVNAATTDGPLHVLVGEDAHRWVADAQALSFEDWLAAAQAEFFDR
jgi:NAD(P)-dependent dehydrogenase (short-subunit alcohol dehydrogenase family)